MPRCHHLAALPLAALSLVLVVPAARGAGDDAPARIAAYAERLGQPASRKALRDLLAELPSDDASGRAELAVALERCGGVVALGGLSGLLDSSEAAVRLAALRGLRHTRLADESLRRRLRRLAGATSAVEREHALRLLGRAGSAADVPLLIDHAARGHPGAFPALRGLTGQRIPDVAVRWSAWWSGVERRLREGVRATLQQLEEAAAGPAAEGLRQAVLASAWVDPPRLVEVLGGWLDRWDANLHRQAGLIAAGAGAAELAPALARRLERLTPDTPAHAAVSDALAALGWRRDES